MCVIAQNEFCETRTMRVRGWVAPIRTSEAVMRPSYEDLCLSMLRAEITLANSYALIAETGAVAEMRRDYFEKAHRKIKIIRVFERERLLQIPAGTREVIRSLEQRMANLDLSMPAASLNSSSMKVVEGDKGSPRD